MPGRQSPIIAANTNTGGEGNTRLHLPNPSHRHPPLPSQPPVVLDKRGHFER